MDRGDTEEASSSSSSEGSGDDDLGDKDRSSGDPRDAGM